MRVVMLVPAAFGGHGGIAQALRDFIDALSRRADIDEIVVLPRTIHEAPGPLPPKVDFRARAAGGKLAFACELVALALDRRGFDLALSGHLYLLPLLHLALPGRRTPTGCFIYGVDAWASAGRTGEAWAIRRTGFMISSSRFTADRFSRWSGYDRRRALAMRHAVDHNRFTPGPRPAALAQRYGLAGRKVLMGLGRLDAKDRYKGFDEVMAALAGPLAHRRDLCYLIAGDGSDRPRLEALAVSLGIADRVMFAGFVPDAEKADHYRLADCFLLAGWGEGFGIALIEAIACGVPSIASNLDASAEAVGDGRVGQIVDPTDIPALATAIERALDLPHGIVPDGFEEFWIESLERRIGDRILRPLAAGLLPDEAT